jgi:hypothetical protein
MSAAEVTCHSRTEGSNDRSTTVTGHSTQASLVTLRERLLAPEESGCARPDAVDRYQVNWHQIANDRRLWLQGAIRSPMQRIAKSHLQHNFSDVLR